GAELLTTARVAGTMAAKDAWRRMPPALPTPLTAAFCGLGVEDAQVTCTMTVQAFARQTLEGYALAGASAALLALLDAVKAQEQAADGSVPVARVTGLGVVQNVVA